VEANAIEVKNVSKSFKLPHEKQGSIKNIFVNIFNSKKGYEKQRVLQDVSFSVKNEENKVNELLHSLKESDFKNKKILAQKLMGDEKNIVALKA
jgi:hypothetical protein